MYQPLLQNIKALVKCNNMFVFPALTMEILQWENLQELIFLSPLFSGEQGWVNARFA